jgi:hypothetical protein
MSWPPLPDIIGDEIREDEMGGACSTRGRGEKYIHYFGWKT